MEHCFVRTLPLLCVFSPKYIITEKSSRGVLPHVTFFSHFYISTCRPDCTMKSLFACQTVIIFFIPLCVRIAGAADLLLLCD